MICTEERVSDRQIDELAERLFNKRGTINLDKNDLSAVLKGKDGVLLSALQEKEDSRTFLQSFFARLGEIPEMAQTESIMFYFGNSAERPLKMEDMTLVSDFLSPYPDIDCIWGVKMNDEGVGLSAVAVFSVERN